VSTTSPTENSDGVVSVSAKELLRTPSVVPLLLTSFFTVMVTMMQITALGKYLYDLSQRDLDLGLLGLAQFAPAFLLMTVSGSFADRFDRRRVVAGGLLVELLCSAALAWYAVSGNSEVWPIFSLVIVFGTGRAFVNPSLRSMPADIAPDGGLPRMIALNVTCWQAAMIIGPVLAGFLYVVSPAAPFMAATVLTAVAAALIGFARARPDRVTHDPALSQKSALSAPSDEYRPAETLDVLGEENADTIIHADPTVETSTESRWHQTFEGFRVIRKSPALLGVISLDLFAVLFGGAVALLPAIAETRLGVGAIGLGWLRAAGGIGAALVTIILSARPIQRRVGPIMFAAVAVFGLFTVVLGITRSFVIAFGCMFFLSAADSISVFIRSSLVPLVTPSAARGRVMAVEGVFIGASNELGAFESGVAGQLLGTGRAVAFGGIATIGVVIAWILMFPVLRRFDRFPQRPPD